MDLVKIGQFLAQLRREGNMTQQELGEQLGVSNKTVSRWETGTYLPPVEMLQSMSELYGITINEILSGQRLTESDYREKAEENIKSALNASAFTLKEKTAFYKRKWWKEHFVSTAAVLLLCLALVLYGTAHENGLHLIGTIGGLVYIAKRRNEMMIYVEDRAYDGSGQR